MNCQLKFPDEKNISRLNAMFTKHLAWIYYQLIDALAVPYHSWECLFEQMFIRSKFDWTNICIHSYMTIRTLHCNKFLRIYKTNHLNLTINYTVFDANCYKHWCHLIFIMKFLAEILWNSKTSLSSTQFIVDKYTLFDINLVSL